MNQALTIMFRDNIVKRSVFGRKRLLLFDAYKFHFTKMALSGISRK